MGAALWSFPRVANLSTIGATSSDALIPAGRFLGMARKKIRYPTLLLLGYLTRLLPRVEVGYLCPTRNETAYPTAILQFSSARNACGARCCGKTLMSTKVSSLSAFDEKFGFFY